VEKLKYLTRKYKDALRNVGVQRSGMVFLLLIFEDPPH
jgi:hypothetical protein